jgi:hypothetical protein
MLDVREFQLRAGAPHAVGDQLGLEAVDETLGECVAVGVAGAADGRQDVVGGERQGVDAGDALGAAISVTHEADLSDAMPTRERHL